MTDSFIHEYKDGMKPKYRAGVLGAPLTTQSANQIQDMGTRLNEGIKNIEISAISPEIADGIPKEHFEEMRRLGKLTDSKVSVHAPIVDASGFTQQGWSEQKRVEAEKQFESVLNNAKLLDDSGNVPIVFHGANMFGADWDKTLEETYKTKEVKKEFERMGKKIPERPARVITVVDQIHGQVMPLEFKEKYNLGEETKDAWTVERQLHSLNRNHWDQEKLKVFSQMKEIMQIEPMKNQVYNDLQKYEKLARANALHEKEQIEMGKLAHSYNTMQSHIKTINEHVNSSVQDMYNTYIQCIDEKKLSEHDKLRLKEDKAALEIISSNLKEIDKNREKVESKFRPNMPKEESDKLSAEWNKFMADRSALVSQAISTMNIAPELFKPVNEFAIDKASNTFSNLAFKAFKKHGEKAPIIAIENSYPNMPISNAKDLKATIEESRKKLVNKLVKEENLDRKEAEKIASKAIGATWDVGHINLLRKAGYSEKEILDEAKRIAPFVKHVHLTDNFGYNDTHLPPGMGNVPIQKTLEMLEKHGDMEGVRQIIEAGNFVQNFKESPYPYALEALGSPIYSIGGAPYWAETRKAQAQDYYSVGFGEILPEYHFKQFYGGGWAAVPRELGGEKAGSPEKGRFAAGGE
ncbi:hypothetical protein J4427_00595 [Candidatus Woesearchaeota archaeon]|nr:hypothetical protein [Candidatus Woesearchaeota archaeon]